MIDKDLVEACYRAILGREPESAEVVAEKIKWSESVENLIRDLMGSDEFLQRTHSDQVLFWQIANAQRAAPARINTDMSEAQRQELFARLQAQWRALGEQDPFWSVLTDEHYRADQIDAEARAAFYASGAEHAGLVDVYCARSGIKIPRGVCVELGSGVGRITKHLATRFDKVIAIDISEGNLRESRAMAEQEGIANIEHRLLSSPDELKSLAPFDFMYSSMVLQHNPPPIQKYQLDAMLKNLRPEGAFLFQTQCFYPNYTFIIEEYLSSSPETMDMHSLPMPAILKVLERHGCRLREISADMCTSRAGSYTFFGLARPARRGLLRRLFAC